MRRAISIILAAVLVTTPIKVVLAQADQQKSQVTATDIPSVVPPHTDQTPVRIGVPVVEPNSGAALLFTAAMRDMTTANDPLPYAAPFRRVSTAEWIVIVVVGVVVLVLAVALIGCGTSNLCR